MLIIKSTTCVLCVQSSIVQISCNIYVVEVVCFNHTRMNGHNEDGAPYNVNTSVFKTIS